MTLAPPAGLQRHTEISQNDQLPSAIHARRFGIHITLVGNVPYEGLDLGTASQEVLREPQVHCL